MSKYELKDQIDFEAVKKAAEEFYRSLGEIYCPYFKDRIVFNAKGWEHLQYKNRMRQRNTKDQYTRFKLLSIVPDILKMSHTLQGICTINSFEMVKTNSRWEHVMKPVTFWEFIAVIKDSRVRIVIKQIENGQKYFFSVIPYWKIKPGTNI